MSKIYYCPEHPREEEHRDFYGHGTAHETQLVDENGILTDVVSGDTIDRPDEFFCIHCDAIAIHGVPPSALEQLAEQAEGNP